MSAARIDTHDAFLRVFFGDGHHADYHWFWLRHECSHDRHPITNERTLCSSDVPIGIHPTSVELGGDEVRIRWRGEHVQRAASRYSLAWLREHAYAPDREDVPPPSADVGTIEVTLDRDGLLPPHWRESLARDGAIVGRARPGFTTSPDHTERLVDQIAGAGLGVIETHFGRVEDLRTDNTTNQNTDQLGYTDSAIGLHTDQPFLDHPPRYQLLHCVRPAERGGASSLADADGIARHLAAHDAPTLARLETTPVRFHRKQKAFERLVVSPILARHGERYQARLSPFTMAPHRVPFAEMEAWYRAYARFVSLANTRAMRFTLGEGDVILYDNHRMLHGRTGFRGARWVRGVYFDGAPS